MQNLLTTMLPGVPLLIAALLASLRLGAMLLLTPILASGGTPLTVRVLAILGFATVFAIGLQESATQPSSELLARLAVSPGLLMQAAMTELALGATLGVGIHLAFSAFAVAGRLLDIQIGFGLGQVFDPMTHASMPLLATAFSQVAVVVFFLVDGHHALLRGVAYSFERFPMGQPWPIDTAVGPVFKQAAGLLGLAFALAIPVVFCLLITEFVLGVLARNLPQMNMLAIGIPTKVVVGLIALALWFSGIGSVMSRAYSAIFDSWTTMFLAAPPPVPAAPGGRR